MKTVSIELDSEMAGVLISALKEKRSKAAEAIRQLDAQITRLQNTVSADDGIEPKLLPALFSPSKPAAILTPTGRVKQGGTRAAVLEYLQHCNGKGATVAEITKATGTKYSTVHAVLNQLKREKYAIQTGDARWKMP